MEEKKTEVDICILSKASTEELKAVTIKGIETLLASEENIKFNIFIVEGNRSVNYNQYPNTKTLYSYLPFNYNGYMNFAVKEGSSKYVLMANNDLTYEKNWASEIIRQMEKDSSLLSASPFCPQLHKKEQWPHEIHYGYQVRRELAGWAIFVQRRIFDIIGPLDVITNFWFSDDTYARMLIKHNVKHGLVINSIVNHHDKYLGVTGMSLPEAERERLTMGQQAAFNSKYGR